MTHEKKKLHTCLSSSITIFFPFLAFPTSVPTLDSFVTIATIDKTHTKNSQMLLIRYAETSPKACMLHQFVELDVIIPSAYILFVPTSDCWGVV